MKYIRYAFLASMILLLLATPAYAPPPALNKGEQILLITVYVIALCCISSPFVLALLSIASLFLLSMQRALNRVSAHNRLMSPRMVWLNLIPGFHLVWQFVTVIRVTGSLKNEFRERGSDNGSDYGKLLGVAYCSSISLCVFLHAMFLADQSYASWFPWSSKSVIIANNIASHVVCLVSGILFWLRIAGYSRQLAEDESARLSRLRAFDKDDGNAQPETKAEPSEGIQEGDGH